jgi:hypothetical protein
LGLPRTRLSALLSLKLNVGRFLNFVVHFATK